MVKVPIRLLAVDIDGTLLNPQFSISDADLSALHRAHAQGVEIIVVTGRRHTFALPIVQQLGFDLWVISSNGGVTRSLSGETFHRDMLPAQTCRELCGSMREFRGNTVLTFDKETKGALVVEHMNELNGSIQRWANYRGIAREQVMAIGDNYNDIEMLAFAGLPFIMGNASEELRRRNGWAVTLPNDQSGVAAAIEQVMGGR